MTVRARLGIPYARQHRFGAPEPVPLSDDAVAGGGFGPSAPQTAGHALGGIVPGMAVGAIDEQACLTLNVWSPASPGPHPVLVWFHGGSFVIGGTAQPVYDGARLAAEQAVVVVTANYRLGALGFLDARPLGGVANCGVRDCLAALAWVQAHIDRFGGDPDRVVAFGESAGGGLLLHALTAPGARDLVAGAIVQSGATFATLDEERAANVCAAVVARAGLTDAKALTALPVDALVAAQDAAMTDLLGTIGMMPFHPVIDGEVVTARPHEALAAGAFAGRPLVVTTTADEMRLFLPPAEPPTPERLVRRISRYASIDEAAAAGAVAAYAADLGTDDTSAIWATVFSDVEMQLPAHAVVSAHAAHGPVHTGLFTWNGPTVGACHGIDIPFAFGNFGGGWDAFTGAVGDRRVAAEHLSTVVRNAWAAVARTGDPGWPVAPATMLFGAKPTVAAAHPAMARASAAFGR